MKQINKTLGMVKALSPELLSLKDNSDNGFWCWASREIVDSSGDVVMIDGIDLSAYHQPEEGIHLKVLAQHMRELPSGEAPVVGKVTASKVTTSSYKDKMVKGLALYVEWLRDPQTNELLPLAKHYKSMKDAGGVDQVSIGFTANDGSYKPNANGGYDFSGVELFELSLVTVPANASASFIKQKDAVSDTMGPDAFRSIVEKCFEPTLKALVKLTEKLDILESTVAILSEAKNQQTSSPEEDSNSKVTGQSLTEAMKKLDSVLAFLNK